MPDFGVKKPGTFLAGGTQVTESHRKGLTNRKKSQIQENRFAQSLGFKLMPNSGATKWQNAKADGRDEMFVWEMKESEGDKITLDKATIRTVCRHAARALKTPALGLTIHGLPPGVEKDWVAVPRSTFQEMLHACALTKEIQDDRQEIGGPQEEDDEDEETESGHDEG